MNIGFYAGSFDPFTNGHMHVTEVSSKLFDEVVIGIGINTSKKRRYDVNVMKSAIEAALKAKGLNNVVRADFQKSDLAAALGIDEDTILISQIPTCMVTRRQSTSISDTI